MRRLCGSTRSRFAWIRALLWLILTLQVSAHGVSGQDSSAGVAIDEPAALLESYRVAAVDRWEEEIEKLEQRDANEEDPADAILFIGSSSIRRWDEIAVDMAPYRTIRRGYGGSKYSDVAVFAERLHLPSSIPGAGDFRGQRCLRKTGRPFTAGCRKFGSIHRRCLASTPFRCARVADRGDADGEAVGGLAEDSPGE